MDVVDAVLLRMLLIASLSFPASSGRISGLRIAGRYRSAERDCPASLEQTTEWIVTILQPGERTAGEQGRSS